MDVWVWIVIAAVAVVALAAAVYVIVQSRRTEHLKDTFGPEYDRTVERADSRREAERELAAREKRHDALQLEPLSAAARDRFQEEWNATQARFVDDPEGAVHSADDIVARVMQEQGYPTDTDATTRAADLSVEHAEVVDQYRRGHALLQASDDRGDGTENLRQAMQCFRTAFEELIEDREVART